MGEQNSQAAHWSRCALQDSSIFFNLDKICQTSFAEYHSKRNFVERAHAEENRMLSKHGQFKSKPIHKRDTPGSQEHMENMEYVASEVIQCIGQGSFGGSSILCFRGVKRENSVFLDEDETQSFLSLSEAGKQDYTPSTYSAVGGKVLDCLHFVWGVDRDFQSKYISDYRLMNNELIPDKRTSWKDKYTTCLYSITDVECRRFELQPIPDYLRWYKTGELHFLPMEQRALLLGSWDDIPGVFLASNVLDLCFTVVQDLTDELIRQVALLAWIPPSEVKAYHSKLTKIQEKQEKSEKEKQRWKSHPLYRFKTKNELELMCKQQKLPFTSSMAKHELVQLISYKKNEEPPPEISSKLYDGNLSSLPTSLSGLSHLTIPKLKSILSYHHMPVVGKKDQLVLRVHMIRHNRSDAVTAREEKQLEDLVSMVRTIIRKQKSLTITHHIYRSRKYSLQKSESHFISAPPHVKSEEDLDALFQPLILFMLRQREQRKKSDSISALKPCTDVTIEESDTFSK